MRGPNEESGERAQGEESDGVTRRQFLEITAATAVAAGTGGLAWAAEVRQGVPYRTLGRTGEKVSLVGVGGSHIGRVSETGEPPDHPRRARQRHQLPRQLLGLQRRQERGVGWARPCRDGYRQKAFLMTKIDGRTKKAAAAAARRVAQAAADRPHRPAAVPRGHPHERPGPHLRGRRRHGGGAGGEEGGQGPLHRLHRPQEPGDPPAHARDGRCPQLQLRHRADAAQRDGRALPQLREAGPAGGAQARDRRARHEADGRSTSSSTARPSPRSSACTTR